MFSIYDGRNKFYQWDKDRKLIVEDETITQVHFANCFCPNARVCEVSDGLVDVPNELLTEDLDIRVWGYDGGMTKHEQVFEVERRVKPADYIYTQSDYWTAEKAVEEALEEAKANGDFKGDKGDKGDAGAINFVVVSELPATGSGDSIYLLPNATGENNNFDEFIFQNGAWEKIGSAGVEVNLDEYVKNTDYPVYADGKAGVVKSNPYEYGIGARSADGYLYIVQADNAKIDNWQNCYHPITPNNLDYAVKKALAHTNHTTWTDDEKAAAREQIGLDVAANKVGLVKIGQYGTHGINITADTGLLSLAQATEENIDNRVNYKPIVPANLDYAVKQALTNPLNTTWTEEEKAAARALLGIE